MDSASPAPAQGSAPAARGTSNASLRWRILRRALVACSAAASSSPAEQRAKCQQRAKETNSVPDQLTPYHHNQLQNKQKRLPEVSYLDDTDFQDRYNIGAIGLVWKFPVLVYHCVNHSDMFRSKKVPELGSGYGLAGFVIAAGTDADEVVISDGNPQHISQAIPSEAQSLARYVDTVMQLELFFLSCNRKLLDCAHIPTRKIESRIRVGMQ
ncbi:hypothetical protein ABZP36_006530 [Zizania latifolia]